MTKDTERYAQLHFDKKIKKVCTEKALTQTHRQKLI